VAKDVFRGASKAKVGQPALSVRGQDDQVHPLLPRDCVNFHVGDSAANESFITRPPANGPLRKRAEMLLDPREQLNLGETLNRGLGRAARTTGIKNVKQRDPRASRSRQERRIFHDGAGTGSQINRHQDAS